MEASIKDGYLHIKIAVNSPPTASKTGKSLIVATSGGNKPTAAMVDNKPVIIGLNAYINK